MSGTDRGHIERLDGLRGLAAVTVLVSHTSNELNLFGGMLGGGAGNMGVALFFVLSGFLMGYLYADTEITFKSCYAYGLKRFARVYPLFFVVVSVAALVYFLRGSPDDGLWPLHLDLWLRHVLLISGISVFWTIPVECHFYAVFLLLWGYFRLNIDNRWLNAGLGIFILIYIGFVMNSGSVQLQRANLLTGYLFFVGVFISRISTHLSNIRKFGSVMFAAALIFYVVCFPEIYEHIFSTEQMMFRSFETVLAVSLLLMSALIPSRAAELLLGNVFARWCGRISYSMYLLHLPIVIGISYLWRDMLGLQHVGFAVVCIFLAVFAVSWASNISLERPLQRLALRWMMKTPR